VAGNLEVRCARSIGSRRVHPVEGSRFRLTIHRAAALWRAKKLALLQAWPRLLDVDPQLALVLAPRHPERFEAVATLIERSGVAWMRRSDWREERQTNSPEPLRPGQVVLLDTIGELASVYSLARCGVCRRQHRSAGGHNPLEPAQFGVPIVMGPHYANFRAITEDLLAHDAVPHCRERESGFGLDRTAAGSG